MLIKIKHHINGIMTAKECLRLSQPKVLHVSQLFRNIEWLLIYNNAYNCGSKHRTLPAQDTKILSGSPKPMGCTATRRWK